MPTSSLKFILGDRNLLHSKERKTPEDHSPIKGRIEARRNYKKSTTYVRTHGFSVRTNRDKYQTPGELYTGEDDEMILDDTSKKTKQELLTKSEKYQNINIEYSHIDTELTMKRALIDYIESDMLNNQTKEMQKIEQTNSYTRKKSLNHKK